MPNYFVQSKRILIVDDEKTLGFFLEQSLRKNIPHCSVEVASSGEEALNKLTYGSYSLLITDLRMSGISGFTLLETARSLHPNIGVILMTAFGSREVQEEADRLDINGYLTKPFRAEQLYDMAQKILLDNDLNNLIEHSATLQANG